MMGRLQEASADRVEACMCSSRLRQLRGCAYQNTCLCFHCCTPHPQATHGIRSEVESQHHVLDRMVRRPSRSSCAVLLCTVLHTCMQQQQL